ncbi:MAG: hypothetical protein WA231_21320, partial [Methylocella sp.]
KPEAKGDKSRAKRQLYSSSLKSWGKSTYVFGLDGSSRLNNRAGVSASRFTALYSVHVPVHVSFDNAR